MPFVDPPEPYVVAPRVEQLEAQQWDGQLVVDDGHALLRDVHITAPLPLDGCRELALIDCRVDGVSLADTPGIELELLRCALTTCDLSGSTIRSITRSTLTGCKLIGTSLAGAAVEDSRIDGGILRYTNLRMAAYLRVAFDNVTLDEADFYDSTLEQVSFDGSELHKVVFDKCRMKSVDLRGASSLGITAATSLQGALISEQQVIELAYAFALASGVEIERSEPIN